MVSGYLCILQSILDHVSCQSIFWDSIFFLLPTVFFFFLVDSAATSATALATAELISVSDSGELVFFFKVFNTFSGFSGYYPKASIFRFTYRDTSPQNDSNIPTTTRMVYPDRTFYNSTEAFSWPTHWEHSWEDNWIFALRFRHFNASKYTQLRANATVILYMVPLDVTLKVNGK